MEYFKIGKLAASHGLTGELILQHSLGKKTSLKGLEAIFIEQTKDNFLPHFIVSTFIKNDTDIYINLEGIDSKEIARKLTPKDVWLQEDDFKKLGLNHSQTIYVISENGVSSAVATLILRQWGYQAKNFAGGFEFLRRGN